MAVLTLLIGIGFLDFLVFIYIYIQRRFNSWKRNVGIYAPYDIDDQTASWVSLSVRQISDLLKRSSMSYRIIQSDNELSRYPIILNPYGGAYPENNISSLESLESIFDYVREGGIYINIADVPFYYAFDKNLGRRIGITPNIHPLTTAISFLSVKISEKLKVRVYPVDRNNKWKIDTGPDKDRVFSIHEGYINLFNQTISIDHTECSPQICLPYGKGWFIFSTFRLSKKNLEELGKIVKKSIELINK
jgi:hypothetical protein